MIIIIDKELFMRNTKQKKLVYDLVKGCCDHPTADQIYERARAVEPNISLGTVYRNLANLAESGELLKLETADKSLHYDGNMTYHEHFLCSSCGKIVDVWNQRISTQKLEDEGLTVEAIKVIYYGKCSDCKES